MWCCAARWLGRKQTPSLEAFTRVSPDFALQRLRSPSFKSGHVLSYSNHLQDLGLCLLCAVCFVWSRAGEERRGKGGDNTENTRKRSKKGEHKRWERSENKCGDI